MRCRSDPGAWPPHPPRIPGTAMGVAGLFVRPAIARIRYRYSWRIGIHGAEGSGGHGP